MSKEIAGEFPLLEDKMLKACTLGRHPADLHALGRFGVEMQALSCYFRVEMSKNAPERWARIVASRLAPEQVQRLYETLKSGYFDFMNELVKCGSVEEPDALDDRMLEPAFLDGWRAATAVMTAHRQDNYTHGFLAGEDGVIDLMIDHKDKFDGHDFYEFIEKKVLEGRHR